MIKESNRLEIVHATAKSVSYASTLNNLVCCHVYKIYCNEVSNHPLCHLDHVKASAVVGGT